MKFLFYSLSICVLLFGCKNTPQIVDPIPVHTSFTIESSEVGETRIINVWTPIGYETTKDSLPVMYMADGGIKEDFPHIANTLDKLIKSKSIAPIILVGIENTERRRDLSGPTEVETDKEIAPVVGGSENFRAFINNELFPEINKRYRTSNKKGILGESLSGLFVVETFFLKPEMFDYYIAFDPSLWWNNQFLVRNSNKNLNDSLYIEKTFWFAGSGVEDISVSTNQFNKILLDKNLKNLKWKYSDEPKEKHSTIFRATKEKALIWTLNMK